jgi:enoyl-CoA hydratase/carnithine racemase
VTEKPRPKAGVFCFGAKVRGVAGLVVGQISYKSKKTVLDIGPIQATAEEKHNVPIPEIAAIVAVVAGLGLVLVGQRRT